MSIPQRPSRDRVCHQSAHSSVQRRLAQALGVLLTLVVAAPAVAQGEPDAPSPEEVEAPGEVNAPSEPAAQEQAPSPGDDEQVEGEQGADEARAEEDEPSDGSVEEDVSTSSEDEQPSRDPEVEAREEAMFGSSEDELDEPPEDAARDEAIFGESSEDAREEEMFGGGDGDTSRDDAMFGGDDGYSSDAASEIADKLAEAEDELAIGGFLFMQLNYAMPDGLEFDDQRLSAPNLVDVYFDARPNDRVRAYIRGRLNYTYSLDAAAAEQSALAAGDQENQTLTLGLGNAGFTGGQRLRTQLDQLWVKFDIARRLWVTIGRQRIRWGSGRFWNPTDFLNAQQINPIAIFDQRLGVDMLKLHLPLERLGWNFYAIAALGEADALDDIGGALRGEFVFGAAELALSVAARQQTVNGPQPIAAPPPLMGNIYEPELEWPQTSTPLRLGAQLSSALGPFDVGVEAALTRGLAEPFYRGEFSTDFTNLAFPEDYSRADEWIPQVVLSADIILQYGDSDSLILGGEYFFNDAGYEDSELFLWLALQGGLRPLYLGRHYAALAASLPAPGEWNDSNFTLSTVGNLSDRSFLARFDYSVRILTDLNLNAYAMYHFGENGEFNYGLEIPAVPGQTEEPTIIPAPMLELGGALRMNF